MTGKLVRILDGSVTPHEYKPGHLKLMRDESRDERDSLHRRGYLRLVRCLDPDLAARAAAEMLDAAQYHRVDLAADGSPAGFRIGVIKPVHAGLSQGVAECCGFLTGTAFMQWLETLAGARLNRTKQPTLFRMQRGDAIDVHDDVSDQSDNRLSAVIHLSRDWRRGYGGNTVVGPVKCIQHKAGSDGYPVRRWIFMNRRSVLAPVFNSLVIMALKPGMAHGVTPVRADAFRLTIVATYAAQGSDARSF